MPTPPTNAAAIPWALILDIADQLGVVGLQALKAKITNPAILAAIDEAIVLLKAFQPPADAAGEPTIYPIVCQGQRYGRGLNPTPRHRLCGAQPFLPTPAQLAATPAKFLTLPSVMSILGNDRYGDCVSAEEGASKMAFSIWGKAGVPPITTITTQTVVDWATAHGVRNGADLEPVIEWMQQGGMQATDGHVYADGAPLSVNYTDDAILRAAITLGPVKIGVAANQLESAVNSTNGGSGWVLTGAYHDSREDHCVALWGFGTIADLTAMFRSAGVPVTLPAGIDTTQPAYALYTWGTVGIIDRDSMLNITGEAWYRNPTTPGVTPPVPTPQPTPAPTPSPAPVPVPVPPAGLTTSILVDTGLFGRKTLGFKDGLLVSEI